jgi:predicted nucleotidyltransferase
MGFIIPILGLTTMTSSQVADTLFSKVRQTVLALLFGQPDRSFHGAEVIRLARSGSGAVQRELQRLERSGLVTAARVGNQKHYRANVRSPVFPELRGLIVKTVGLAEPLREALAPHAERINAAFVYGSVAKGEETAESDVDLMVIGEDVTYSDFFDGFLNAQQVLHRPIHANFVSPDEWRRKLHEGRAFFSKINAQPKIFVVGSQEDLPA